MLAQALPLVSWASPRYRPSVLTSIAIPRVEGFWIRVEGWAGDAEDLALACRGEDRSFGWVSSWESARPCRQCLNTRAAPVRRTQPKIPATNQTTGEALEAPLDLRREGRSVEGRDPGDWGLACSV